MTREEAINVLNDYDINFERNTAEEVAEAHEMAIKVLQQQPSENEKIIRISKGTLKARTSKYVIYDVEWLKTHFNTTEAKIYGQPNEDCISRKAVLDSLKQQAENMLCWSERYAEQRKGILTAINIVSDLLSVTPQPKVEGARGDIPLQQSVPKMPQSEERTEERTETHECDYISRKDIGLTNLEILMCNGDYKEALKMLLDKIEKAPSVNPQQKTGQQKTGHWIKHKHNGKPYFKCSECLYFAPIEYSYCPNCGAKMQEEKK